MSVSAWVVYDWQAGVVYTVRPPTQENAAEAAAAVSSPGHPHSPVTECHGADLRNAHAHGRMQGHIEAERRRA